MNTKLNQYQPDVVFHPGVTLKEKLEEMRMSNKEFALRTGKPEKTIIAVLKGESSLTADMAILFEKVTHIPASFWINKQSRYSEYVARKNHEQDIEEAKKWADEFPYSEMSKNSWVPSTRNKEERVSNLLSFFGIASYKSWDSLYMQSELKVAAYTSLEFTHEPHAISAWLRIGELQSKEIESTAFDIKKLKENIPSLRELMINQPRDFFNRLKELCLEAGVKVIYTPRLPKVPLCGSTRWINETPLVQLTARYRQNDRFWFYFFHELGHIILHGKKFISLEGLDFSSVDQSKEDEANEYAQKCTFTKEQEKTLLKEHPTGITAEEIKDYAKRFNTHPAIIIGRLQHEGLIKYSVGRDLIVPIDLKSL
jgi:HTH-type transcriptional regulator / antitoxin HigA